jgi:hypothetical protein
LRSKGRLPKILSFTDPQLAAARELEFIGHAQALVVGIHIV